MTASDSEIEGTILRLVAARGPDKTVCPSEVARVVDGLGTPHESWRRLMQPVRRVAIKLAAKGEIAILRKGKPVADLATLKGVYRLGLQAPVRE